MTSQEPETPRQALERTEGRLQLGCGALLGTTLGIGEGLWWLGADASGWAYAVFVGVHALIFALLARRYGDRLWQWEGWKRWL